MEVSFNSIAIVTTCNVIMLIKVALRHVAHFVIMASMKLSGEIFAVRHSPYAVSKFELGMPSERGENGWEHFFGRKRNERKYEQNYRPLNLICVSCVMVDINV